MRTRIDPGTAPEGLVFRVTRGDGVVVWFDPVPAMDDLTDDDLSLLTERHSEVARANAAPGHPSVLHVFCGDTGICTGTFVIVAGDLTP